jgi:hypothetical protein
MYDWSTWNHDVNKLLAQHGDRLERLEKYLGLGDDPDGLNHAIAKAVVGTVMQAVQLLRKEIAEGLRYRGTWEPDVDYVTNDLVSFAGGAHVALGPSRGQRPGQGPPWKLAVKSDTVLLRRLIREELEHAGQGSRR